MDFPKSVPSVGLVDGKFVDEDPLAATPGSLIPSAWGNAITLEVLNVIQAAGLQPDEADLTQLLKAIRSIGRASDWDYAVDTGAAGVYVATYSPAVTAVSDSMILWFKAKTANAGASTFSPNGMPAKPIVGLSNIALQGGEIVVNGLCGVMWSSVLDSWILVQNTGGSVQIPSGTKSLHAPNVAQIQGQSLTAFTVTGASPSFTLTVIPSIAAYAANQRFRVKFSAASSGADTLNISAKGAKSLKQYDATGAKVPAVFAAGQLADVEFDGVDIVLLDRLPVVPTVPDATTADSGISRFGTAAEVLAGGLANVGVSPLTLNSARPLSQCARAWVTWRWVSGTPVIQKAYNVSSLTDVAVGRVRPNFTNNMADSNYVAVGINTAQIGGTNLAIRAASPTDLPTDKTVTGVELVCGNGSSATDAGEANVVFFN